LREKVAEGRMRGWFGTLPGGVTFSALAGAYPSSVGFADPFSRKGRRGVPSYLVRSNE
jgi:hypothetical protein